MRYPTALVAVGLLCATAAANAEVSYTVTAVSDYDFRGVSLSAKDPALQASIDYAHDSGFYAGAWASNIDYGS
ncbi:MAG TPA: TorF family putative porin, partial [Steroidobacteraceae bacterium]